MKPANSSARQLQLSIVWLSSTVAMIPLSGFCIATIWNWFMPIIGLPTVTWIQAYYLSFAVKAIFGSSSNESDITKNIKNIINGTCTEYDDINLSDEELIILLTILKTVITSAIYLIIGLFLSRFL